ncbi:hypothetical protein [Thioalkalivibrio sulfidiphilus]|uniref:hypothetical protein n=1 Tax=Thioalkalivibrio sulfidiphilus TaxID=1033854 RepID=UPI00036A2F1A|nr:hypothetical protein [Thioalkalivibrio sulfidiphilus]
MRTIERTLAIFILATVLATHAHALEGNPKAISLYWGQGVDSDLLQLPGDFLNNDLVYEASYLTALSYLQPLPTPAPVQSVFDWLYLPGTQTGLEGILVKHFGLQENWEVDLAYFLQFRGWDLGPISARPGFAIGLSYAFGTPSYEDGPIDDPDRRYKFQSFQAYEIEWSARQSARLALFTRVHHRSGIYGVIAPRRVGSNFVTAGIRFAL